jgi:DNA mismatch repair protein MutS2
MRTGNDPLNRMVYPDNFEWKIGFDRIRRELASNCISSMGRACVEQLVFSSEYEYLRHELDITDEFRRILISGKAFPSQDYYDLRQELRRISIAGTFMEPEQLAELRSSVRTILEIKAYMEKCDAQSFPLLLEETGPMIVSPWIPGSLDRIIDDKGDIRDDASPALLELRRKQEQQKKLVEKRIRTIYRSLKKEGVAADEAEITIRNGRSVIPLPAANKRRIRGFIHDESSTGQTVYIEPEEIFDLNNEIRELESAEKREIIRILMAFTDELRPEVALLSLTYDILGRLDFIRAKALFALAVDGVLPKFYEGMRMDLRRAINPLLHLSGKHLKKEVVPLDLLLNDEYRILIISGPNAGGKSVCLKTAGLLQYMLQCGLLVPLRDDSEMGIFQSLFIEIGDEQSIENDLSTYSSHLKNIRYLTEHAATGSLFLIDEFGSGTEPQPGGAIAEAVLEHLSSSRAWGVVTTHYMNLKLMAGQVDGIKNGAMLFDTKKMKPLFQLTIGKPGSSFAFEIAAKTGLSKEILDQAASKTGSKTLDFEKQLADLESEKRELEQQRLEFELADELLSGLVKKYSDLHEKLEASRKQILEEAKKEAEELLSGANQKIEQTIRKIKESQADKEETKTVREELQDFKTQLRESAITEKKELIKQQGGGGDKPLIKKLPDKPEIKKAPLKTGGYALIRGQDTYVEISGIQGNYATVVRDNIRLKIPLDQLEGCEKPKTRKGSEGNSRFLNYKLQLNEKMAGFKTQIDIRGKRVDEVLPLLQQFIDDAILLSIHEVSILHGKGNGILRTIVREYLASIQEVASYKDEALEHGGSGITLVKFR